MGVKGMKKITGILMVVSLIMAMSILAFASTSAEEKLAAQNEAMKLTLVQAGAQKTGCHSAGC